MPTFTKMRSEAQLQVYWLMDQITYSVHIYIYRLTTLKLDHFTIHSVSWQLSFLTALIVLPTTKIIYGIDLRVWLPACYFVYIWPFVILPVQSELFVKPLSMVI